MVLWDQSGKRDGNVAVMYMGGVRLVEVLATALGRLLWIPLPMELSPVVNVVLYSGVACIHDCCRGWV